METYGVPRVLFGPGLANRVVANRRRARRSPRDLARVDIVLLVASAVGLAAATANRLRDTAVT